MMPPLIDYAHTLANLIRQRKTLHITRSHLEREADAQRLHLTPSGGWEGKNEEQRRVASEKTLAADEILKAICAKLAEAQDSLAEVQAELDAVQELASAERWRIRERLADALMARAGGEPAEVAGQAAPEFDRAAQVEIDAQAEDYADLIETESIPF